MSVDVTSLLAALQDVVAASTRPMGPRRPPTPEVGEIRPDGSGFRFEVPDLGDIRYNPPAPAAIAVRPSSPALPGGTTYTAGKYHPDAMWIGQRESGLKTTAINNWDSNAKRGNASYGVWQLTKENRRHYAKKLGIANPDTTNFDEQYAMATAYVNDRYGGWEKARAFWERNKAY